MNSISEFGRRLCEKPCGRVRCDVAHSECVNVNHTAVCECKEEFHGNGSVACIQNGFSEESNGKSYRMFDDTYVEFENASDKCKRLGTTLPILDSADTISIVKRYLETSNFTAFEKWDRSSRRVWLGLIMDRSRRAQVRRSSGLVWADGARVISYPASSSLFVWEARRLLRQEVSYADHTKNYALYIDGDIGKLPGGGRKGAAVLCELVPGGVPG